MRKTLYKCTFNWYGQVIVLYRYGLNKDHAKRLCVYFLSKRLGRTISTIFNYFNGTRDNYRIDIEKPKNRRRKDVEENPSNTKKGVENSHQK